MSATAETTVRLPDPRRYPRGGRQPLLELAAATDPDGGPQLISAVRELLLRGADDQIRLALGTAPDRECYARLWRALCAASEGAGAGDTGVAATVFALPLVIVTGSRRRAELPGALRDAGALSSVLQRAGALGASRNTGIGNALVSLETLEALRPSAVLGWRATDGTSGPRAVAAEAIVVRAGEEAHLRFLLGGSITAADAPSVCETASHVGAWGLAFAREAGRQLAVPGVELLALPRPPRGILRAACEGRRAQLEVALNLFLSNSLKHARAAAGEPSLVISVHEGATEGAELRVSLSAVLDDTLLEGYCWPLHPLDDPNDIADGIRQFAADCRLTDVRLVETVLPYGGAGASRFVRADAAPPMKH